MSEHIDEFLNNFLIKFPKENGYSIAIAFTGHNGSITIAKGRTILEVIELERFVNGKNFDFSIRPWFNPPTNNVKNMRAEKIKTILLSVASYIKRKYTDVFDIGIYVDRYSILPADSGGNINFLNFFNVKKWHKVPHHIAHAYGAFYQSSYSKALVITYDGGSIDGCLNGFIFDRNLEKPKHLFGFSITSPFNASKIYYKFGNILGDIKFTKVNASLTYPGKIMGLAGYGKIDLELKEFLKEFLKSTKGKTELMENLNISEDVAIKCFSPFPKIRESFPDPTNEERFFGERSYNLTASLQAAFEEFFFENVLSLVEEHKHLPLCYSGGCAMNIILNTKIHDEWNNEIFVPPDPSDCGLSHGAMLSLTQPEFPTKTAYLGSKLLDLDLLPTYLYEKAGITNHLYRTELLNVKKLANHIAKGKIIGIARGRSEIGPRALGNRSIICSVAIPDMKDIINAKVKNREWFRPFAPVVRLESVNKYFHWDKETPYMSFCPRVREEYLDKIKPIVHIDGTARVQTITKEQNEFLYNLLGEVEKTTGYDMLLNTSFNVDSKPIINSIRDAFEVLEKTELDGILIEDILIIKNMES